MKNLTDIDRRHKFQSREEIIELIVSSAKQAYHPYQWQLGKDAMHDLYISVLYDYTDGIIENAQRVRDLYREKIPDTNPPEYKEHLSHQPELGGFSALMWVVDKLAEWDKEKEPQVCPRCGQAMAR